MSAAVPNQSFPSAFAASLRPDLPVAVATNVVVGLVFVAEVDVVVALSFSTGEAMAADANRAVTKISRTAMTAMLTSWVDKGQRSPAKSFCMYILVLKTGISISLHRVDHLLHS